MKKPIATALFSAMVLSCGIQTTEPIHWESIPKNPQIEVKEVVAPKIRAKPPKQTSGVITRATPVREFDQADAELLLKIAQAEAGNQGIEGMELIMEVIINRANSETFPSTISDVIFQSGQFETVTNGTYKTVEVSPEAHLALAEIEKGITFDEKIIGFETTVNGKALEKYFDYAYTIGDHDFYYEKKESR